MTARNLLEHHFAEHIDTVTQTLDIVRGPFSDLVVACVKSIQAGGKILFLGNGGSAADAQHLATELVVRYKKNRPTIASIALTTDTSLLTAAGNDLGYETIFARQVEALAKPEDIVIGISTSGNSENVILALKEAQKKKATTVAFTKRSGSRLSQLSDIMIAVPSDSTARIQEMHILVGHALCEALEIELGLASEED
jgi:D-sedoheptulose 7-phosphate isomerase